MSAPKVTIFTDGSCRNTGVGGWAAMLVCGTETLHMTGNEADTTNNRMELMAVLKALEVLTVSCRVTICTDSQYVKNGINSWANYWSRHNWKNKDGKKKKNRDLWEKILEMKERHRVKASWVKGHAGIVENEIVDSLAQSMSNRPVNE